MTTESPVCLLAVADLHLSDKPPVARAAELDWFTAMERQLRQLSAIKDKYECPLICCGDLFDRACPSIRLINWAIDNLPQMYAIAGNHDVPNHRLEEMDRCAYGTLVKAGTIIDLKPDEPKALGLAGGAIVLHPFPCGYPVKPLARNNRSDLSLHVAVCHEYLWKVGTGYQGASDEQRVKRVRKRLVGYDVAFFGDNHIAFDCKAVSKYPQVVNCGGFFKRKIDEKDHRPSVALLREDGTVTRRQLDCSADKWLDADQMPAAANDVGFSSFIEELGSLGATAMDFAAAVHRLLERDKVPQRVKDYMLQALEGKK